MTKSIVVALQAAGKTRDSFLRRLPFLEEALGPVRSTSFRLARRIVNILGAGHAVDDLSTFHEANLVLLALPEMQVACVVDDLVKAPFSWKNKTVVLCDSQMDSGVLSKLAFLGASTGSLTPVPSLDNGLFITEGDLRAVRLARQLVSREGVRVLQMTRGRKSLFDAAIGFSTGLALPLFTATVETMRGCGMTQRDAVFLADRMVQRTLRAYLKAGRKGWEGPLALKDKPGLRRQLQALTKMDPLMATYYLENAMLAVRMFHKDPAWVSELRREVFSRPAELQA